MLKPPVTCLAFAVAAVSSRKTHTIATPYTTANRSSCSRRTVQRYIFRNPHVTIFVEAEDGTGATTEWEIETGSTPIMQRSGWTRDFLSPGDTVIVRAHPERSGRHSAILNTLETTDGRLWSQIERRRGRERRGREHRRDLERHRLDEPAAPSA